MSLPAHTLAAIRKSAESFLTQRARVERPTFDEDDYGVPDETTTQVVSSSIPCRVIQRGAAGDEHLDTVENTDVAASEWFVLMPHDANVQPEDILTIAGAYFRVTGTDEAAADRPLLEVQAGRRR